MHAVQLALHVEVAVVTVECVVCFSDQSPVQS